MRSESRRDAKRPPGGDVKSRRHDACGAAATPAPVLLWTERLGIADEDRREKADERASESSKPARCNKPPAAPGRVQGRAPPPRSGPMIAHGEGTSDHENAEIARPARIAAENGGRAAQPPPIRHIASEDESDRRSANQELDVIARLETSGKALQSRNPEISAQQT